MRILRQSIVTVLLSVLPTIPTLAQTSVADGGLRSDIAYGVRAGYTGWDGLNQVHLGAHLKLGEILPNVQLTPNLEAGFGDDAVIVTVNGDVLYSFTEFFEHPWNLYGGGALSFNYFNPEGLGSATDLGLSAVVGLERTLANGHQGLVEVRLGLMDSPDIKLTFGYTFFLTVSLPQPWAERHLLAGVMALWRRLYAGRNLFRLAAGAGWIKLHLAGDEHAGLLLSGIPGARLVLRGFGPLPAPLAAALPLTRKHPLQILLADAQLVSCGLLPDDRVAAFRLRRTQGEEVVLLHQLFGAQANTTVVDRQNKLLWSVHRPPHPALAIWPPDTTWHHGADTDAPADFDELVLAHLTRACAAQVLTSNRRVLGRRRKSATRLLENLDRDLAIADQGDQYRRKAEALAANLHTLRRGQAAVTLPDLTDGTPLTIALDPARTPAANLEMWFRRARKADKGLAIIKARRDQAATEAEQLAAADERLTAMTTETTDALTQLAQGLRWRADHADLFPQGGDRPRGHSPDEPARPFRRYLVDGVWSVWVGRNNKENDELTHRAAHNRDIWLHAQGVSGSHVILRTGGHPERVPRAVLEKAAALAALNSKARHSQIVPVIHTEKRYVRKPRKAPAGTAVCLRDQSIFVEPGIKAGVEPA